MYLHNSPKSKSVRSMLRMWQILCLFFLLLSCFPSSGLAQFGDEVEIPENVVTFQVRLEPENPRPGEHARLIVDLQIHPESGWHIFSVIPGEGDFAPIPTTLSFEAEPLVSLGPVYENNPITAADPVLDQVLSFHEKTATLFQNVFIPENIAAGTELTGKQALHGKLRYQACSDRVCLPPKTKSFTLQISIGSGAARTEFQTPQFAVDAVPAEAASELDEALRKGFWGFIGLAVIAGLLALLTPCVFPMIPVTVAFFTKQDESGHKETLRLATLFGAGIVGTYTVTGMLLSMILGAAGAVRFATNGWVNLAIGAMFTLFAFSLMGFMQLNAPGGIGTLADRWSRRLSGPAGVLAMGLAFTLTSFTCTVQFVGTLLIAAAQGLWFWPIVGMLVFSTVFAFPFFLLGLFPRLIQTMRSKSGNWMEHLKIILGLLELAAAFKFFSNTDLVWQWGVMDRDFVLSAWVVICTIGALFLLGSVTIHQNRVEKTGGFGFTAALLFAMLGIYLARGLGDTPLNPWVDTYLPPSLQSSSVPERPAQGKPDFSTNPESSAKIAADFLAWKTDLPKALLQAKVEGKRVFIDFTGYTCVNCRWMEKNIFSHPDIIGRFRKDFILVQLYTDGGENAAANQRLQIQRFKTVALPLYVILDANDKVLARHAGILKPVADFLKFLGS